MRVTMVTTSCTQLCVHYSIESGARYFSPRSQGGGETYGNVDDSAAVDIGGAEGALWQFGDTPDEVGDGDQVQNTDYVVVVDVSRDEWAAWRWGRSSALLKNSQGRTHDKEG